MAVCRWLGVAGVDPTDYQDAGNWSGAVPVNADDIIFGTSGGSQDCLVNLNQGAVIPASVRVSKGFTGKIGAVGNTLRYSHITGSLSYEGLGDEAWFEFVHAANATDVIVTATGPGANAFHLDSAAGGIDLWLCKGKVTIDTGATLNVETFVGSISSIGSDAELTIAAGVNFAVGSTLYQYGGVITSASGAATLQVISLAGTFTLTGTGQVNTYRMHGGYVHHNSSGNVAHAIVESGTLNASGSPGMTITDGQLWWRGVINIANGLWNIIITNGIQKFGSGTVIVDEGRVLTPA